MIQARKATDIDKKYKARLEALQVEQTGLNRRIKSQRERSQQITAEFYALKGEWLRVSGPNPIDWSGTR